MGGAGVLLLLLVAAGAVIGRHRMRTDGGTETQHPAPKPPHQTKPSSSSRTLPDDIELGDGYAAINLPVVWQPSSPQPPLTTLSNVPTAYNSNSRHVSLNLDQQLPSSATSPTPAVTISLSRTTSATTPNAAATGNSSSGNSFMDAGIIMSPAASADMTALLDAHALGQMRIDWNDIKLADKPLGRGGFGAVYRGSWQGIKVAVKMLEGVSTSSVGDLRREALMMSRVRHPGIAVVYGLAIADSELQATSKGHAAVALIMK